MARTNTHIDVEQWDMIIHPRSNLTTLRPRQNGRHFPDDIFEWIFVNENARISIKISLKFVPRGPINDIPALVQIMAWRLPGDKPLSEPIVVRLPTHICVARPQWVNNSLVKSSLNLGLGWVIHLTEDNGRDYKSMAKFQLIYVGKTETTIDVYIVVSGKRGIRDLYN